jgi:hypothetical protein
MKTLKVSIILCIIFGFISQSAEPQVSQQLNYKIVNRSKSALEVRQDSNFSRINTSRNYGLNFLVPYKFDLTVQKDLTIAIPVIDYFELINSPSSFNNSWAAFILKPVLPDYIITDTANKNWSSLILNPPSGIYNYYNQSKKTNQSGLSDNILYRISGGIFKYSTKAAYPSLSQPKK